MINQIINNGVDPFLVTREKTHCFWADEISLVDANGREVWASITSCRRKVNQYWMEFGIDRQGVIEKQYKYVDLSNIGIPEKFLLKRNPKEVAIAVAGQRLYHKLCTSQFLSEDYRDNLDIEEFIEVIISDKDPREVIKKLEMVVAKIESGQELTKSDNQFKDQFFISLLGKDLLGSPSVKFLDPEDTIVFKIALAQAYQENRNNIPSFIDEKDFINLILKQNGTDNPIDLLTKVRSLHEVPYLYRDFAKKFQDYGIKNHIELVDYFLRHLDEIDIVNQEDVQAEQLEQLAEKAANMFGLDQFYYNLLIEHKDLARHYWSSFTEFLKDMEFADMSFKKLEKKLENASIEAVLQNLKSDMDLYKRCQGTFDAVKLTFSRYQRILESTPKLADEVEFLKDDFVALHDILLRVKQDWTDEEYAKLRCNVVEDLWQMKVGRFVDKVHTIPLDWKGWKKEHLVDIITEANNLIERGNTKKITRVFKESTHLARTFTIVPKANRIIVHLKQKDVDSEANCGSNKKVTIALIVEKGKKPYLEADIVIYDDKQAVLAEWKSLKKYQGHPNIPRIAKNVNSYGDKFTWTQEYFAIPDLRHAFKCPLKERLHLMIGVLKGYRHMHSVGDAHNDPKLENMSARRLPDGTLESFPFDFGFSCKIGAQATGRTDLYLNPQKASKLAIGRPYCTSAVGDLWGYGISLYEMLCTPPESNLVDAIQPEFLHEIDINAGSDAEFQRVLRNVTQDRVNQSFANFNVIGNGIPGDGQEIALLNGELREILIHLLQVNAQDPVDADGLIDRNALLAKDDQFIARLEAVCDSLQG